MGRKKKAGRDAFRADLQRVDKQIPYYYSNEVKKLLKRPDMDSIYIQNVRKGLAVDWEVLEALKKLAEQNTPETVEA